MSKVLVFIIHCIRPMRKKVIVHLIIPDGFIVQVPVLTTIGFLKDAPLVNIHGFNVYHHNRLILVSFLFQSSQKSL